MMNIEASFIISLDFELMWGVKDSRTISGYGRNIVGVREAIPAMLQLFQRYGIKATWATVGFLLFESKESLLNAIPSCLPTYDDARLNPYAMFESIGQSEHDDPYHFGLSLAKEIVGSSGMELASHTFSHYYCLEPGQTIEQFRADLKASKAAIRAVSGTEPISVIFPRNQVNRGYLSICNELGFRAYRGVKSSFIYSPSSQNSVVKRAFRLMDSYVPITGCSDLGPSLEHEIINVPASLFLRPYSQKLRALHRVHLARIKREMEMAAKLGGAFHLWWHPHNFGVMLNENMFFLEDILTHFKHLEASYGMKSITMGEAALKRFGRGA